MVFLILLIITNFLLYLGAVRRTPTELLAWMVAHVVTLIIQIILIVYFIVVIFIIASPNTQNSWLGLPDGMSSNTSEFQQALRTNLGSNIPKLLALVCLAPATAVACKVVWREKENMEIQIRDKQVRQSDKLMSTSL